MLSSCSCVVTLPCRFDCLLFHTVSSLELSFHCSLTGFLRTMWRKRTLNRPPPCWMPRPSFSVLLQEGRTAWSTLRVIRTTTSLVASTRSINTTRSLFNTFTDLFVINAFILCRFYQALLSVSRCLWMSRL